MLEEVNLFYLLWLIPIGIVVAIIYDIRRAKNRRRPLSYHSPNRDTDNPEDRGDVYGDAASDDQIMWQPLHVRWQKQQNKEHRDWLRKMNKKRWEQEDKEAGVRPKEKWD